MNFSQKNRVGLWELLKRSSRALKNPKEAYELILPDESINRVVVIPFLFLWGAVFIIAHFYIAQGTNIFIYNHALITIPTLSIYSYLIWKLGSLFFWSLSRFLAKDLTLNQAEIGTFYLWFIWATMPFFDLPHRIFGWPVVLMGGAGAHTSWLFAFPYLAVFSFYFLKKIGLKSKSEWLGILFASMSVPVLGRYVIEQIPLWLHYGVQARFGDSLAPGFHLASLLVVLLTLIATLVLYLLLKNRHQVWSVVGVGFLVSSLTIFLWVQILPSAPFFRHSNLPAGVIENIITGVNGVGTSQYSHSYTWTGSDLETGTITHGPLSSSTYWVDTYSDAVDLDFNPSVHEINSITLTVHFTSSTTNDSVIVTGPNAQGCIKGSGASIYYCSAWQNDLNGTSTKTFTIHRGSIMTYASSGLGASTSSAAWTELLSGFTQDNGTLIVHTYTAGTEDDNTPTGDTIAFDAAQVSFEYRDTGELYVAIATSTTVASTTGVYIITTGLSLASSSLPAGRYLVFWGAQLAQTSGTAKFYVVGRLDRVSSTEQILGYTVPMLASASSSNPQHGDALNGVWLGDLNGTESLRLGYRASINGGVVYVGDRYLMAIRLDGTLVQNTDYWAVGPTTTSTNDVTNVATSTFTTVVSTTQTFGATSRPYLVMGYLELQPSGTLNGCAVRLLVDGTEINGGETLTPQNYGDDTLVIYNYVQVASTSIGSGSKTVDLQIQSLETSAICDARASRIYVFSTDVFEPIGYADYPNILLSQTAPYTSSSLPLLNYAPQSVQNLIVLSSSKLNSVTSTFSTITRVLETTIAFATNGIGVQNTSGTSAVLKPFWPVLSGGLMQSVSTSTKTFVIQNGNFPNLGTNGGQYYPNIIVWPVKLARHLIQSGYRWYSNANGTSTGAALAATSTAATAPEKGTPFRLKLLLHNKSSTLPAKSQPFKLQFAARSSTCDTAFSGETYTDVERTTGTIRFYNNTTPSDASSIVASSTDPTNGTSTVIAQAYEEANSFVTTASTTDGNSAMWDFSLVDNSATASSSFCFRTVKIDNTTLNTYSFIPEIRTVGTSPTIGLITFNDGSNIVLSPATTTRVYASSSISDADGAGDILFATSTFYRSGVGSSCRYDEKNCYQIASSSCIFAASTSSVSCYADVQYFAQGTGVASSSFPSESWQAAITITDKQGLTNTTSSVAGLVNVGLLTAIDISTSSINYATNTAGQNTGTSTQRVAVINYGNTSTSLKVSGTDLTSSTNSIAVTNEHYASGSFTFGNNERSLSTVTTAFTGFTLNASPHAPTGIRDEDLPHRPQDVGFQAYNNYLYLIGGNASNTFLSASPTTTVLYSELSATGTPLTWTNTQALPLAVLAAGSVQHNGYLYNLGGVDAAENVTTTVVFAKINENGTVGSWQSTTALPSGKAKLGAVVYNNYLYSLGGITSFSGAGTSSVHYAAINTSTGALGAWTVTTAFPGTKAVNKSALAHNGYMYQIAAQNNGEFPTALNTTTVLYSQINSNGTLGSWATTTPFPVAGVNYPQLNGNVIFSSADSTRDLYYATFRDTGGLYNWSISSGTKATSTGAETATWNGRLYIVGGLSAESLSPNKVVQHLSLNTRDTHWGLSVPLSTPAGTYSGTIAFTSVFDP